MKLRKSALFLLANIVGLSLMAEGYQLNSQSARQVGMGHLGTALKLGGESMLFNPAGLSYMNGKVDASLGMTAIFVNVNYENLAGDYRAKSDNPMGTPIFGYVGLKLTDKLFGGVSITNPAGNSLCWPDNWKGSHLVQNITLKSFSVQPTLSYKFSEKFSIGAGLMVNFGDFEMNKGLLPVGALTPYLASPTMPEAYKTVIRNTATISPMDVNLKGKSSTSYGFNVGILYNPTEDLSIGLSYRSKVMMKVDEGDASVSYGSTELESLFGALAGSNQSIAGAMALDGQNFKAELPVPSNLNLGVAYKVSKDLLLSAELQYVGWKAYDTLSFQFETMTAKYVKNFSNSMIYRIGGEYKASEKLKLRLGFIYDTTPVDASHYNAETPGTNKFSLTCGLTYKVLENMDVDLGFQYLNGEKIKGSTPQAPAAAFEGTYKSVAYLPAIGLHFNF